MSDTESGKPGPLSVSGVRAVYHYAPLHYLPFILRRQALLCKESLTQEGFADRHFRSTSQKQDVQRGFGSYVHLTLDAHPPILQAKLAKGFPHFEVAVPAVDVEKHEYLLCRFNIAKARYFRGARQEPKESPANGRYHGKLLLPVAKTETERSELFRANFGRNMIEVLIPGELPLDAGAALKFFHPDDFALAQEIATALDARLTLELDGEATYNPKANYRQAVASAIDRAMKDATWRGEGLEFDRV